jgi:hypothetical protein
MYPEFMQDIERMNKMFELPVNKSITPDSLLADKLIKFHKTLSDEVSEILDIAEPLNTPKYIDGMPHYPTVDINHYVSLADLLGDVIVYCASEALKHGIPIDSVLKAIMASQWSKLGANGEAIKDSNSKFLKGPNYKPPEEAIKEVLQANNRKVAVESKTESINVDIHTSPNGDITMEDYNDYDSTSRN